MSMEDDRAPTSIKTFACLRLWFLHHRGGLI